MSIEAPETFLGSPDNLFILILSIHEIPWPCPFPIEPTVS